MHLTAVFVIDLQDANKKTNLKKNSAYYPFLKIHLHQFSNYPFLKIHLHQFSKIKSSVADPCLMPAKNYFFYTIFSAYYFLKVHLHHFSKIKSQKESQNSRNQGFLSIFA
jgi:hypothetical protein